MVFVLHSKQFPQFHVTYFNSTYMYKSAYVWILIHRLFLFLIESIAVWIDPNVTLSCPPTVMVDEMSFPEELYAWMISPLWCLVLIIISFLGDTISAQSGDIIHAYNSFGKDISSTISVGGHDNVTFGSIQTAIDSIRNNNNWWIKIHT